MIESRNTEKISLNCLLFKYDYLLTLLFDSTAACMNQGYLPFVCIIIDGGSNITTVIVRSSLSCQTKFTGRGIMKLMSLTGQ